MWSPEQYRKFAVERGRAFFDLLAHVPLENAQNVADLGCGSGELTQELARRFPTATITGVDSSRSMIAAALAQSSTFPNVTFAEGDLETWEPPQPLDLVFANASFQWVAGHARLLDTWIGRLAPRGCLAFQVPANFDAPSHALLHSVRQSPRWVVKLGEAAKREIPVAELSWYVHYLSERGFTVDAWETTYMHVLKGPDAVLEWTRGTALRPVLAKLDVHDRAELEAEYSALLRKAYPKQTFGTLFPFSRFFVVARAA